MKNGEITISVHSALNTEVKSTMYISCMFLVLCFTDGLRQDYPFRNTSLPWGDRVKDLVGRLTLEEIVVQMSRGGSGPKASPAPAIPRLGIGPFSWNTECLRGDVYAGNATSFPQAIGLAASFR